MFALFFDLEISIFPNVALSVASSLPPCGRGFFTPDGGQNDKEESNWSFAFIQKITKLVFLVRTPYALRFEPESHLPE